MSPHMSVPRGGKNDYIALSVTDLLKNDMLEKCCKAPMFVARNAQAEPISRVCQCSGPVLLECFEHVSWLGC